MSVTRAAARSSILCVRRATGSTAIRSVAQELNRPCLWFPAATTPRRRSRASFARLVLDPGPTMTFIADTMTFESDRCRRNRDGRSHVRTRAQSRADVECLARARSWYGPTRIASDDSAARGCARLIPDPFPGRLRPSSGTSPNTASVRRRRNPVFYASGGLPVADIPSQCHGHILHPRRFRLPNGVPGDALPDDCR